MQMSRNPPPSVLATRCFAVWRQCLPSPCSLPPCTLQTSISIKGARPRLDAITLFLSSRSMLLFTCFLKPSRKRFETGLESILDPFLNPKSFFDGIRCCIYAKSEFKQLSKRFQGFLLSQGRPSRAQSASEQILKMSSLQSFYWK